MLPHDHAPRPKRHAPLTMIIGIVLLVYSRPPHLLGKLILQLLRNHSRLSPLPQQQLACKYCVGLEYFLCFQWPCYDASIRY
jgi:hypothetical protein